MLHPELLAVASLGLVAGTLIGCIGIGGVIIVPVLVGAGYRVATAISVAMAGFILTGIVGTWVFVRHGTLDWRRVGPLCAGAMPAAIVGALGAQTLPAPVLELLIAGMTILSGLQSLRPGRQEVGPEVGQLAREPRELSRSGWAGIGAAAGLVSALTGTGGPAALMPMLLWLEVPILATVGLAQVIQLPIGILATLGNVASGSSDLLLGLSLGLGLTVGARIGAELAHRLDQRILRALVALMLLGVGIVMLGRVGLAALRSSHS